MNEQPANDSTLFLLHKGTEQSTVVFVFTAIGIVTLSASGMFNAIVYGWYDILATLIWCVLTHSSVGIACHRTSKATCSNRSTFTLLASPDVVIMVRNT